MTGSDQLDQLCHWSFPADENNESEHAACRTIPQDYIGGEYEFGFKPQSLKMKGQCAYGCPGEENGPWVNG